MEDMTQSFAQKVDAVFDRMRDWNAALTQDDVALLQKAYKYQYLLFV